MREKYKSTRYKFPFYKKGNSDRELLADTTPPSLCPPHIDKKSRNDINIFSKIKINLKNIKIYLYYCLFFTINFNENAYQFYRRTKNTKFR